MGRGIAQVAAGAGHTVLLHDAKEDAAATAKAAVAQDLAKRVDKGRMAASQQEALLERLRSCASLSELAPAALVIEAVVEDLGVKRRLFADLEEICAPEAILASNTSSLSITAIAAALQRPGRCVGMHFFNPAPIMALVEVVSGLATDPTVAATVEATASAWGKSTVQARSTPGFIVNRVARPFYAEALRLLEEGAADPATIDAVLRESGGFRMGPFELMDLVGHDVNSAVTRSVYDGFFQDPRFKPSFTQLELVAAGRLGRKSGRGFYDYAPGATKPEAATLLPGRKPGRLVVLGDPGLLQPIVALAEAAGLEVERHVGRGMLCLEGATIAATDGRSATERAAAENIENLVLVDHALDYARAGRVALAAADQAGPRALASAAGLFQALGKAVSPLDDLPGMAVLRTVAMLANEAADAVAQGVASAAAIDLAMAKGVNYPTGPLAWAEKIGLDRVLFALDALARTYGEDRYRASALLRRKVWGRTRFHA
jgi:3-hydroxybutyryl-CoA dehydrogenase